MASTYEEFWQFGAYAVVGNSGGRTFPKLTYQGLKRQGKTVFAIDPVATEIEGDRVYPDLASLPEPVEAVVLELPKAETAEWVARVAEAGIRDLWIHMGTDTPEAVALAEEKGLSLRKGTCGVMYLTPQFSYHSIHKWIMKLIGKY